MEISIPVPVRPRWISARRIEENAVCEYWTVWELLEFERVVCFDYEAEVMYD